MVSYQHIFEISKMELDLKVVLSGGQTFVWTEDENSCWSGVINKSFVTLKHNENILLCDVKSFNGLTREESREEIDQYFRLSTLRLESYYKQWSEADSHFAKVSDILPGLRILRQPPVENFFTFICTQNNNVSRISDLVKKLCRNFGNLLAPNVYSFPTVDSLSGGNVEDFLSTNGFGYRAKYISKSAKMLKHLGGEKYLLNLRKEPYEEARSALLQFPGIGPKVADCICLFSLDKSEAVPIDTHVWSIAIRDYNLVKKSKTLTQNSYQAIVDYFQNLFGDTAGWATSVLFCVDLLKPSIKKGVKRACVSSMEDIPTLRKT